MTEAERLAWIMSVCLVCLARPLPDADPELWDEWADQRERLMEALPTVQTFRSGAE